MIVVDKLHKSFGERQIFSDFSLKIEEGEFAVLSGASGSGKTTLLNMIGALESFDAGEIVVDGLSLKEKKHTNHYFSEVVGFLFQNFVLIEDKTVVQNLKMVKSSNRSGVSIEEALSAVGLVDKMKHRVYTLSGGEQQRVALARLMIKNCKVILADEPTGSLDRENAQKVMEILKKLNESGKTVVLVTHDDWVKQQGERLIRL